MLKSGAGARELGVLFADSRLLVDGICVAGGIPRFPPCLRQHADEGAYAWRLRLSRAMPAGGSLPRKKPMRFRPRLGRMPHLQLHVRPASRSRVEKHWSMPWQARQLSTWVR